MITGHMSRCPSMEAMNAGCLAIGAEDCQGWIRHARRYFPRCIARENIQCDVDENLWHNRQERMGLNVKDKIYIYIYIYMYIFFLKVFPPISFLW